MKLKKSQIKEIIKEELEPFIKAELFSRQLIKEIASFQQRPDTPWAVYVLSPFCMNKEWLAGYITDPEYETDALSNKGIIYKFATEKLPKLFKDQNPGENAYEDYYFSMYRLAWVGREEDKEKFNYEGYKKEGHLEYRGVPYEPPAGHKTCGASVEQRKATLKKIAARTGRKLSSEDVKNGVVARLPFRHNYDENQPKDLLWIAVKGENGEETLVKKVVPRGKLPSDVVGASQELHDTNFERGAKYRNPLSALFKKRPR